MSRASGTGRHRTVIRAIAGCVVLIVVLTGCTSTVSGKAHYGASGSWVEAPDAKVDIHNTNGSEGDRLAGNAISDIQAFWTQQMPKTFDGKAYAPVIGGFYSEDPSNPGSLPCGASASDIKFNAFYCPSKDLVVWDRTGLLPTLISRYGNYTVALVLAHEWGHAIQARAIPQRERTIIRETQADCFAGAFTRWAVDGHAAHFHPDPPQLDKALAGFLNFADPAGTEQTAAQAHGNAFDRVSALQSGYDNGANYCASSKNFGPTRTFTELPFTTGDEATKGNLPFADAVTLGKKDLSDYWNKEYPKLFNKQWKQPDVKVYDDDSLPSCDGDKVDAIISYCAKDDTIYLQRNPGMEALYAKTGDYAVISLLATAYGMAARDQAGKSTTDQKALLGSICLAGVYTAQLFTITADAMNQVPQSKWPRVSAALLSAGDLDEAIQALLIGVNASAFDGPQGTSGFQRVNIFQQGVRQGFGVCNKF